MRSLTHHPLVQVVLAWQNDISAELVLDGLDVEFAPVHTQTARMDLVFSLGERFTDTGAPAGIGGGVEFRTDVFDAASIAALIERLQRVVVAMVADPDRRLSSVDLLDAPSMRGWMWWVIGRCWRSRWWSRCRFRGCSPRRWPAVLR